MASAAPSFSETCSLEEILQCAICLETLQDPVTTDCGHSFCKKCLKVATENINKICPMCKTPLGRLPEVNIILRDIVQKQKQRKRKEENVDIYTDMDAEVAIAIWIEQVLKPEESRPPCRMFNVPTHLENNFSTERLNGHKSWAAPVKNLDDGVCQKLGRPLEMDSRKQQSCFMEDGPEEVVPTGIRQREEKSLQVCQFCNWSNVTTFRGLRIHQGKMGCTPKGIRIPNPKHCNRKKPEQVKVDQRSKSAKRLSFKEENSPVPPGRKIFTNPIPASSAAAIATSQSAFQRSAMSKPARQQPARQQPGVPTLPQVNRKPPIAPKPAVRPKEERVQPQRRSQIAECGGRKGGERATAGAATIKEEPRSPVPIPARSVQKPFYPEPGHRQQDPSAAGQVHGLAGEPPRDKDKKENVMVERERFKLELRQKPQMRKDKIRNPRAAEEACENKPDSTHGSSQMNSASGGSTKEDPRPHYERAESDFPTAIKVRQLAQMFSAGETQETAVQPKEKHRETQPRPVEVQGAAVHPKQKDGKNQKKPPAHHPTVSDPENSDKANTVGPGEPSSSGDVSQPEFLTGMKVKELAQIFSAKTIQETVVQPKNKEQRKKPPQAKFPAQRFSARATSVRPKEPERKDRRQSQKVPDSTGARNNPAGAEATKEEDPEPSSETARRQDFSTGVKVKQLARMFSAAAERKARPKKRH